MAGCCSWLLPMLTWLFALDGHLIVPWIQWLDGNDLNVNAYSEVVELVSGRAGDECLCGLRDVEPLSLVELKSLVVVVTTWSHWPQSGLTQPLRHVGK